MCLQNDCLTCLLALHTITFSMISILQSCLSSAQVKSKLCVEYVKSKIWAYDVSLSFQSSIPSVIDVSDCVLAQFFY